jgi:tetratricopeptide (TPR) repeat protein
MPTQPDHHRSMSSAPEHVASPAQLLEAGLAHHRAGDMASAARCYQLALERAPGDARGWHLLGLTHAQAGDAADAKALFLRALAIDPPYAEAHYDLGNLHNRLGQSAEAVASYRAAVLTEGPWRAKAWNELGTVLNRLGQTDAAIAAWREALAIEPARIDTRYNLTAYRAVLSAQPRHREAKRGLEAASRQADEPD